MSVRAAWVVILDWTGSYCRALSAPQLYASLFNQYPSIACVCAWWLSSTVTVDVGECRRMTSKDMSVSNISVQRHLLPVSVKQYKKTSSTDPDAIWGFMSLCCRKIEERSNVNSSNNSRWYGELDGEKVFFSQHASCRIMFRSDMFFGHFSMINSILSCVLLMNIQWCNRISGCLLMMQLGVKRAVHIQLGKSVCVDFSQLPQINLWCIILFVCGDFFPPDGCFLKQSAGPSGVFSVFSFFLLRVSQWSICKSGLVPVCRHDFYSWDLSWREQLWWEKSRERGKKGMEGGKYQVNRPHRQRFLWTGREQADRGQRQRGR